MTDYIDYPFCTVIYSKDALVRQHKRCMFKGKSVRADHDQIIDHVVWEHCGKGSSSFWTSTNCSAWDEDRTRFCLQDIIDICRYNGVEYTQSNNTITLSDICEEICLRVKAIITERNEKMYIKWSYAPYMYRNSVTPIIHRNEVCTDEQQITVLDIEQLANMFNFET